MRYSLLVFFALAAHVHAGEPVRAHWPIMEFVQYSAAVAPQADAQHPMPSAGVQIPKLLAFDADGALVWVGEPAAFDPASIDRGQVFGPATGFDVLLDQLDQAWAFYPDARHGSATTRPSENVDAAARTVVIVIPTHRPGACPPCDAAVSGQSGIPADWNLVIAAIAK